MPGVPYRAVFFTLASNPALSHAVFRFRTELFVDHLGWSLPMHNGIERDQFDTANAIYCALLEDNAVIGCFRAVSCDKTYLSRSIFPHLATTKQYPTSSEALEISRFGVAEEHQLAGLTLYSLMFRLALPRNVNALVAIVELSHERLLGKIGLKTIRYGDVHIVGFSNDGGWILAVAGEIPLSPESQPRLSEILQLTQQMDIVDETHILGRTLLSA